jgi:peptidoglycan/xylan/chitin deacetylase (PgdA/CDA1 family)
MAYLVRTPRLVSKVLFPGYLWSIEKSEKTLYLSFDDGPHPEATTYVLDLLKEYNAKATFFCIGKNVAAFPDIYSRIKNEGHRVGNHTMNHLNGWKTGDKDYINNIMEAAKYIDSKLFRPPYGRITRFQAQSLKDAANFKIVMWTVLSGDFDLSITGEQCFKNVRKKAAAGSIVVFHDSEKAMPRMMPALKMTLDHFSKEGYSFRSIN